MNIRHLRYFAALARERHYGRAAAACNITQPTLSEAIRQLELDLDVPLVDRGGQRFRGLTPEGERVLGWAQRMLADEGALAQELAELKHGLGGTLRFGVIPAAMGVAPLLVAEFCRRHPLATVSILAKSSIEIQRGLDAFELEAGLTYLENEPLKNVRSRTVYRERYLFLTPAGGAFDTHETVGWDEIAEIPLCLLTPDMQNRRIIDRLFRNAGVAKPRVIVETNSVHALIAHVCLGPWSTVVPHSFLGVFRGHHPVGTRAIPLIAAGPASQAVGVVVSDREPLPPLASAFLAATGAADVSGIVDERAPLPVRSEMPMGHRRNPI
jgi:DNA-binding transcriptional LysR family regulator